jgi:hypothetical protein
MKITHKGKLATQILSVVLCALTLIMLAATLCPYFTMAEKYDYYTNQDPKTFHFSLTDVMWLRTKDVITFFREVHEPKLAFPINEFVTNMVLSYLLCLGTIATSAWFASNEYKRYPSLASGILTHICGIGAGVFGLMGYFGNAMLTEANPTFAYILPIIQILICVMTVVAIARFVVWLLTERQLAKEKKARLALL